MPEYQLPESFVTVFEAEVKHDYQQRVAKFKDAVRVKTGVRGRRVRFNRIGKGEASQKAPGADVPLMNPERDSVFAVPVPYFAAQTFAPEDLMRTNQAPDEDAVITISAALERTIDRVLIDAMVAGWTPYATSGLGDPSDPLNLAHLSEIDAVFDEEEIDESERFLAVGPRQKQQAINTEVLTSNDFVDRGTISSGRMVKPVLGRNWIMSNMLPNVPASNPVAKSCIAWHRPAVGLAYVEDVKMEFAWLPKQHEWLVKGWVDLGAVVVDPIGVHEVQFLNSLPTP